MASTQVPQETNAIQYLRSLPSIRARCTEVHKLAQQNKLRYFDYHPEKEQEVIDFCAGIISVRQTIPIRDVI